MNIRSKITIPMILLPLAASVIVLIVCIVLFLGQAEAVQKERISNAANLFQDDINIKLHDVEQSSKAMANDRALIEDYGNRRDLLIRAQTLKDEAGVDFVTVTDEKGVVIYCSYSPVANKKSIADTPLVKSALEGNHLSGIIGDDVVILAIQSASPVYNSHKKLVGTVTVGMRIDTEEFVDAVQSMTGSEVTVSLANERIATTIQNEDETRAIGTKINEEVWEDVKQGNNHVGKVKVLGEDVIAEYRPLMNGEEVVGMIFVGLYTKDIDNAIMRFIMVGIIVTLVAMIAAAIIGIVLSGRIVNPIRKLVNIAHQMALGDVNVDLKTETNDETAELTRAFAGMANSFKKQADVLSAIADGDYTVDIKPESSVDVVGNAIDSMITNNNELLNKIRMTSEQVSRGSLQIANSAQELSSGSSEQAVTIQKFSETIRELKSQAEHSDIISQRTFNASGEAGRLMGESIEYMQQMAVAMKEIDQSSRSIGDIINIIENIAFQTNILALNAAVEAARAGIKGKGFAVVAAEVRKLATKSAEAANQSTELITSSHNKVEMGNDITTKANESLLKVAEIAKNNTLNMKESSNASSLQIEMIRELTEGIEQISSVIELNSATAEENAAAAEEMSAQSVNLDNIIMEFKMKADKE